MADPDYSDLSTHSDVFSPLSIINTNPHLRIETKTVTALTQSQATELPIRK